MTFSQRLGYVPQKTMQIESMDNNLRNRIYNTTINMLHCAEEKSCQFGFGYEDILKYVLDKFGILLRSDGQNLDNFTKLLYGDNKIWYQTYDVLELCIEYIKGYMTIGSYIHIDFLDKFRKDLNDILTEEKSAYRLVDDIFVPITNTSEIESLEQSSQTKFKSVNIHIQKALKLYSDRKNPDYENSIKESISAVEAICCQITGLSGSNATLGKTIKKLKDNGINIHSALECAFCSLYGYTSDENGIRHGGIDFKNAPAEDAKYMLISCSAFINYLLEKVGRVGGKLNG